MKLLVCLAVTFFAPLVAFGQSKRVLVIVTQDYCPPCQVFDRVYTIDDEFRNALNRAFDLRELDRSIPSQRLAAEKLGVKVAPAFLVLRDGKPVSTHYGFSPTMEVASVNRAIEDLMDDLGVLWPPAEGEIVPAPKKPIPQPQAEIPQPQAEIPWKPLPIPTPEKKGPVVDQVAREQIGQLDRKVDSIRSEVSNSANKLQLKIEQESKESRSQIESISKSIRESVSLIEREKIVQRDTHSEPAKPVDQPTEAGPTASKWLNVLGWVAKTGIAVAAPEIALPGAAGLAVLGFGWKWWKNRRKPKPLGSVENPIRFADPTEIKTETKYVVSETDILGEAYREAIRRVGNQNRETSPNIIEVLKQVDAAASQLAHGKRVARRPYVAPVSENAP